MSPIPRLLACAALVCAALVSGCAMNVQRPAFPQISFSHLPPLKLDVAKIEVQNDYVSPDTEPNVEHLFPVSVAGTAMNWGRDRLRAVGNSGVARFIVNRASVIEVPLKQKKGIEGFFTNQQAERYDGVVTVTLKILDGSGNERAEASATTKRSQTVPEDITLNDRDKVWFDMTEKMMGSLNTTLEKAIRENLRQWVKN